MTDRFDEGREGLEGASPTRDLWAEAQGRATHAPVPLTTVPEAKRRHPGRWLAAAAVAALVVGVGLAIVSNDDDPVQVGNEGTTGITSPPPTYGVGTQCPFTLTGDPIQLRTGHVPGEVFDTAPAGGPVVPTVMNGYLGDQRVEVSIPGQVVTDLVGERVEDIELQRGTAQLWLTDGFAQVRWFPGSDAPCSSFSVTVFGPDEDFNRHAAVDFADRLVLPTTVETTATSTVTSTTEATTTTVPTTTTEPTGTWPIEGDWTIYSVQPAGASDPTFTAALPASFAGTDVRWNDGCNAWRGAIQRIDGHTFTIPSPAVDGPVKPCPTNPTVSAIACVFGGGPTTASLEGAAGSVYLSLTCENGDQVVLRRQNTGSSPSGQAPFG